MAELDDVAITVFPFVEEGEIVTDRLERRHQNLAPSGPTTYRGRCVKGQGLVVLGGPDKTAARRARPVPGGRRLRQIWLCRRLTNQVAGSRGDLGGKAKVLDAVAAVFRHSMVTRRERR